jgi:O-antigen ligase
MSTVSGLLKGIPIVLLIIWVAKVFNPDLNRKAGLMARDLEVTLEIVSSGASLTQQLMLPLFLMCCLLFIVQSRTMVTRFMLVVAPMILLGVFLLATLLWSESPADTLRRAARQIFLFGAVAAAVVISRSDGRFVSYLQVSSIIVLLVEASFLLMPSISIDPYGNFTGIHTSKNEFGGIAGTFLLMSICILRYYAETPVEKRLAMATIFGWIVLLVLSGSKTPIGLVVFLLPFLLIHHKYLRLVSLGVIVAWLCILVFIPMALIGFGEAPIDFYRSILPEEMLTGRTGIWYHLLFDLKKSWMFGTGYGAYWGVGKVPEALDIQWSYYQLLNTGHSGFVDLCMEIGVIPTTALLVILGAFIVLARESTDAISGTLLTFALLHNCLETSFLHGMHFVWVIMLIALFNILCTSSQKFGIVTRMRRPASARRKSIGGAASGTT